jgi:hypothetical protein
MPTSSGARAGCVRQAGRRPVRRPLSLSDADIDREVLRRGPDDVVFPHANYALVETQSGLTSEMLRSDRFAPGMFPRVAAWFAAHTLTSS